MLRSIEKVKPDLITLFLVLGYVAYLCLWTLTISFNGAPDEYTHFFMVEYIVSNGAVPKIGEPIGGLVGAVSGGVWPAGVFWYYGLPFLHVLGGAATCEIFGGFLPDDLKFLSVRFFDILLGGLFVALGFKVCLRVTKSIRYALIISLSISLLPQVAFVFSYFNSDALALVAVMCVVYAYVAYLDSDSKLNAAKLGGALGLVFLTKIYMWPAIIFVVLMLLGIHLCKRKITTVSLVVMLLFWALVALPMVVFCLMHFGEFTGISGQKNFINEFKNHPGVGFGTCYVLCKDTLFNTDHLSLWLLGSYQSYLGATGWMHVKNSTFFYAGFGGVLIALLFVLTYIVVNIVCKRENKILLLKYVLPIILFVGMLFGIIGASLFASQTGLPQAQGRYLFVTIPFLIYMLGLGYAYFNDGVRK